MRLILQYLLPLLLPTLAYLAWMRHARRRATERGEDAATVNWRDAPWPWLVLMGLIVLLAAFALLADFKGEGLGGNYVPPRMEDGRVVPGHVE